MRGKTVFTGTLAGGMRRWDFRSAAERKRGGIKSSRGFSRNREPARKPLSELDLTHCGAPPARQFPAPVRAGSLLAGLIGLPYIGRSSCRERCCRYVYIWVDALSSQNKTICTYLSH